MCIILDANVAHKFGQPPHEDVKPVVAWLLQPKQLNRVAVGGKLRQELLRIAVIRRLFVQLKRTGRLFEVPDHEVDREEQAVNALVAKLRLSRVDDAHVIALARLSGARLLVSGDVRSRLHQLFKDQRFLRRPKGRIYQSAEHKDLLRKAPKCSRKSQAAGQ